MTDYYQRSIYDIIPVMANPPGNPYYTIDDMVISASSQFATQFQSFNTWRAFDGSVDSAVNCWVATTAACWLKMYLGYFQGGYYDVTSYMLTSPPVGGSLDSTPRNWTLKGSNNGTDWTVLDTRTDELNWDYKESRQYTIASPGNYTWYLFDVSHNNYSFYGTAVGEFNLRGRSVFMYVPSSEVTPIGSIYGIQRGIATDSLPGVYATLNAMIDGIDSMKKISLSSFNVRAENGDVKSMSVVVPSLNDLELIADMADGTLTLWHASNQNIFEIGSLPIASIRYDSGGRNQSITLQASA